MKAIGRVGGIVLLLLIFQSMAIQQKCSSNMECPENSYCNTDLKLCRCKDGFIGQCNISAIVLTNETFKIEINSTNIQYFSISPIQVNRLIDVKINICQIDTLKLLTAYFWGQTGRQQEYTTNLTLVNPMNLTFENQCSYITITNIYFYAQMNGDSQKLILGLYNREDQSVAIAISVDQNDIIGMYLSRYFAIGVMMLLLFSLCSCMLVNIFRRARILNLQRLATQNQTSQQEEYNIDYFQQYLPKKKKEEVIDTQLVCPICLQHVQNGELVRKTPCQHVFHWQCLDSWCKKNANCPVCRFDLTYEYVRAVQDSLNTRPINQKKGYIKNWEEQVEMQERYTGDHSSIREEML